MNYQSNIPRIKVHSMLTDASQCAYHYYYGTERVRIGKWECEFVTLPDRVQVWSCPSCNDPTGVPFVSQSKEDQHFSVLLDGWLGRIQMVEFPATELTRIQQKDESFLSDWMRLYQDNKINRK